MRFDVDSFNRWEAGQKMSIQIIFGLIEDIQQHRELLLNNLLIEAYKHLLQQSWEDLSYFSLLLSLPEENYLAGQMDVVDVDAIHQAREFVKCELAKQLQQYFIDLYQNNHKDESGQFDSATIGRRRIKNLCLAYLNTLETTEYYQLADKQFSIATNMTDQIAALAVIVESKKTC